MTRYFFEWWLLLLLVFVTGNVQIKRAHLSVVSFFILDIQCFSDSALMSNILHADHITMYTNPRGVSGGDAGLAVVLVWLLCCVAFWFYYEVFHVESYLLLVLMFFQSSLASPRLGKTEPVGMIIVQVYVSFECVTFWLFLFCLAPRVGCDLWLWHSLDASFNCCPLCVLLTIPMWCFCCGVLSL